MTLDISKFSIPTNTGIYIMKSKDDKILYIGKAKNLKNRVRTYFLQNQNYKTQKLVEKISDIEFVLTDNEEEAYLLESNMIKRYRPPYNIELKDQQRYTYLRITNEQFPRLVVARRTRAGEFLGSGSVYGPFTHGSSKMLSIGLLRKTFKIRICKKLPKETCLEYHLGNCEGPCQFQEAKNRYSQHILELESILKGKKRLGDFVNKLEHERKDASDKFQYERASEINETVQRLKGLQIKQKMESPSGSNEEYFGIIIIDQTAHIMSFKKLNGVIRDRNKFSFDLVGDNSFANFLSQYYSSSQIPNYIIVSEKLDRKEMLEEVLSRSAGFGVNIIVPSTGKRREMIQLIMKNISLEISKGAEPSLVELQHYLELQTIPRNIECFDVSNNGIDYAVGAMSCIMDGKPLKSGYRKFRIRTVEKQDDFAMINEIVKRRYLKLKLDKTNMPDLILIDGGRGQLNSALDALRTIGINVPCISLAKENEEIYHPRIKKPIIIPKSSQALKILQYARDEAHRFGVAYNRKLRKF